MDRTDEISDGKIWIGKKKRKKDFKTRETSENENFVPHRFK